jgi:hypothetical protein
VLVDQPAEGDDPFGVHRPELRVQKLSHLLLGRDPGRDEVWAELGADGGDDFDGRGGGHSQF